MTIASTGMQHIVIPSNNVYPIKMKLFNASCSQSNSHFRWPVRKYFSSVCGSRFGSVGSRKKRLLRPFTPRPEWLLYWSADAANVFVSAAYTIYPTDIIRTGKKGEWNREARAASDFIADEKTSEMIIFFTPKWSPKIFFVQQKRKRNILPTAHISSTSPTRALIVLSVRCTEPPNALLPFPFTVPRSPQMPNSVEDVHTFGAIQNKYLFTRTEVTSAQRWRWRCCQIDFNHFRYY